MSEAVNDFDDIPVSDEMEKIRKLAEFHNAWIQYPNAEQLLGKLKFFHLYGRHLKEGRIMTLLGSTGTGKTKLLERYTSQANQTNRFRVLYVCLPEKCSRKDAAMAIEGAFGGLYVGQQTKTKIVDRILKYIAAKKVELIILDEFQHVLDKDRDKVILESTDFIKSLVNMAKIPFLLAGLPQVQDIVALNPQLDRRICLQGQHSE
ncbi:TniB family NTP-binding protein [Aestuariispira insulae]|uniref:TniB protein n=1 Tax=Aestuariispira insulae TaxID=1461337 RepID=A0A3D9H8P3_9PROT|nr:TniB family NTP-binding protein [Aestuariispira insulae]RED45855.1 TniB protein [Aestuariispira insulae]